ncbi:zinc finger protein ZFP2-like [Anopheles marshallii]|uniref:zinc finger protein ZFP2-like n=1 Tax=Anopheles marshallii TaxID=1521116 RepID=UPI00237A8168|nr:zinc finger protein ZFP2-like [Anopheles marshallii]
MDLLSPSCCRLCLNNPQAESLVFSVFDTFQGNVLSQLIDELFVIKVLENDRLLSLCLECVNRINTVHKIKQLFVENDRKLRELHQTSQPSVGAFVEELVYTAFASDTLDNANIEVGGSALSQAIETVPNNQSGGASSQKCTTDDRTFTDEETNDATTDLHCDADVKGEPIHENQPTVTKIDCPASLSLIQLPRYKCYFCGVTFESSLQFTHHMPSHFTDVPYTCTECDGLVFKTVREASKHISYHDANERPFQCRICTLRFSTRINSLTHERKMHRYKLKRMERKQGNNGHAKRKVPDKRNKPNNIKASSKAAEKLAQYGCEICGRKFTAKKNYTRHLMIHTGEKPYKCDRCDRSYRQSGELKKHRTIQHMCNKQPTGKGKQTNGKATVANTRSGSAGFPNKRSTVKRVPSR